MAWLDIESGCIVEVSAFAAAAEDFGVVLEET